ncbi:midcut-by-XrtH protein [Diaphorobacter sp. HDW4A]|uniref:midcut-by-XrtH protein n=1 Tax=Diaphorobacter sp. HDW4A TaxID=2714924 RepID=UPI0014097BFA|nr:midcut-by-XrtH protein [Diaphorobacter sp. HDW4A]QIL79402.1 midcut-by-XrtH protein [Diaphorobacter sp. HDW4A]
MKKFKSYFCMLRLRILLGMFLALGGVINAQAQGLIPVVCPTGFVFMTTTNTCELVSDKSYLSTTPDAGSAPSGVPSTLIANVLANDTVFWSIDDTSEPDKVEAANINYFQLAVVTPASNAGVKLKPSTGAVTATASVPPGSYSIVYKACFPGGFQFDPIAFEMTPDMLSEKCSEPTTVTITITDQVAGTCDISLSYMPAGGTPMAVPTLGTFAVGVLAALIAVLAWRSRHHGDKHRMMAVAAMAAAVSLFSMGGSSWIESVRAAGPYEFVNPAGGMLADGGVAYSDPAPLLTVTNTSGKRMRITANGNPAETGTCIVNQELASGASCTTQAYSCTPPVQPVAISNTSAPAIGCTAEPVLATYTNRLNTPIYGEFYVHAPLLTTEPDFDEPGVTTSISYTRNATDAAYDDSDFLTNGEALKSGVATVTSTAPEGYVFAPGNTSTMTWTFPYSCSTSSAG